MAYRGRSSQQDAELERRVSLAARNLGEGVQRIVMAAKGKQSSTEWKSQLLHLLGGADDDPASSASARITSTAIAAAAAAAAGGSVEAVVQPPVESDMDVLLASQQCQNFVVRCLENELPPNMIHCLRLLRVLELQHATQWHQGNPEGLDELVPISSQATEKVSQLLCRLCVDPSVGEQLRPHLFGLLALSGASYPASGVHLAKAASQVIIAFSEHCLSSSLVWFLHDRKMIVHMTDDIKELCSLANSSNNKDNNTAPLGMYGAEAEEHGLWAISLSTVVYLVVNSCNHDCQELLKDFTLAKGNDVLRDAIVNSTSKHGKKLMELVPLLAGCKIEMPPADDDGQGGTADGAFRPPVVPMPSAIASSHVHSSMGSTASNTTTSNSNSNNQKLASNTAAFDIMEDIMYQSSPFLKEYVRKHGHKPDITGNDPSLRDLANFALEASLRGRFADNGNESESPRAQHARQLEQEQKDFDLGTDLLLACLQLYSDHVHNYTLLEQHKHLLTLYLLGFCTFSDENLKVLILKTVEFVVTGVVGSDATKLLGVIVEVFSAICGSLLLRNHGLEPDSKEEQVYMAGLMSDADKICETLEKLFQFDGRVALLMSQGGVISQKVGALMHLLLQESDPSKITWIVNKFEDGGKTYTEPPAWTPLDSVCATLFRVLALLMAQQSKKSVALLYAEPLDSDARYSISATVDSTRAASGPRLNVLLVTAVKELGHDAASAGSRVLESIMSSRESLDLLRADMEFCLNILDYFAVMMGRMCGAQQFATKFTAKRTIKRSTSNLGGASSKVEKASPAPKKAVSVHTLRRTIVLVSMFRHVLETSGLARDAFRICGGFDALVKMLLCICGIAAQPHVENDEDEENSIRECLFVLFGEILAVVDAGTGNKVPDPTDTTDVDAGAAIQATLAVNALVDPVSTQHSPPTPAAQNRSYLRHQGFYLDVAIGISRTMVLENSEDAIRVMDMAMSHMDPSLSVSRAETEKSAKIQLLRNPDGARLILGLVTLLPDSEEGQTLAKRAFDQLIRLCDPSRLGSTLSQLASCGLCWTITNPNQFASLFDDTAHPLHTRFILLLRRIAAISMSYSDFVYMLRCVSRPLLQGESSDSRIRLPVISSSVRRQESKHETTTMTPKELQEREADLNRRLEFLCAVAERGARVPRCILGGDSVNTLSVLLHKTKVEDRLYKASEDGRLNFLEIDCLDSSSLKPGGFLSAGMAAPGSSGGERIWTPLAGSGFSFSLWMRYPKLADESREGNLYILDVSNPSASASTPSAQTPVFFSLWYDLQNQRFNVLSSSSYRGEPTCFPVSPLCPDVWHHVLLTYTPTKRTMMARKSSLSIYVDGRPLETEVKIESIYLPPNSRVIIGAPNPAVAISGVVRGMLPIWDLGPTLMLAAVLMNLDATSMFVFGPEFQGLFWGDRPQRLSLSATGSAAFALLAETGEPGSVAMALRRREIARLEAAGTVSREMGLGGASDEDNDSLGSLGLLCTIPPDCVVFAYRPGSSEKFIRQPITNIFSGKKRSPSERLVNLARMNAGNDIVSTDASVYGKAGIVNPKCFADNVQWAGGPELLMPVVNAASSASTLALALRLIRASTNRHPPNLEAMQGGGGFQMLAVLLKGKEFVNSNVLDQCFAFAVHGFVASPSDDDESDQRSRIPPPLPQGSEFWVFTDLDAMKQLLLNHQVWDLKNSGPALPLRLLSFMNGLVGQRSIHKAFNSRRLHLVGIVRWTLHLMIESAELYTIGETAMRQKSRLRTLSEESREALADTHKTSISNGWYTEAPHVDAVAVGGDPDSPILQASKTLLRRVLTFMLTPGDLEAISEATMFTVSIGGHSVNSSVMDRQRQYMSQGDDIASSDVDKLLPGPVARVYLLRLIEELIVDGVNEIVASAVEKKGGDGEPSRSDPNIMPHAGGIANPNQSYLATAMLGGRAGEGAVHPKHQAAQNFMSAFATYLTPVWFATLLEGCHEEASASAVLRLMILMVQSSPTFAQAFEAAGGFAPLVLSIPKFSTCSNVTTSLLSQLLHVSILHLPCFAIMDASQLNEVFDSEGVLSELMAKANARRIGGRKRDPSCGIFALIAECMGRNIQLAPFDNDLGRKASQTNKAILELLSHRHELSPAFQEFCRTPDFLEPLAQALCLVHDERLQRLQQANTAIATSRMFELGEPKRGSRRASLAEVPENVTPTERFIGKADEQGVATGLGLVMLVRFVVSHAVVSGPVAAPLASSLFRSFPIHASPEQVDAFQLVLIELCKSVVEDAIEIGEPTSIVGCIGICSVLLNRLLSGCFTSESVLHAVNMNIELLQCLADPSSHASRALGNVDHAMVSADAAHIARLTCLSALRRSRSLSPSDPGDPDLQLAVLEQIAANIQPLMIVPKLAANSRRAPGSSCHPPPPTNSASYPLWQGASLSRSSPSWAEILYPDLSEAEEPLRLFVVGLMVEVQILLGDTRDSIRENAISIVVALIQERRGIMSGILIKEISQGDKVVSVDVMNRGGFGALLVAHEAAKSAGGSASKKNYGAFFDWFERHQVEVETVFDGIQAETKRLFPGLDKGAVTAAEAVENEQKVMVLKLASQETTDRTIIGGLERAELAQRCNERTAESHVHWKRQGFDDLAAGAMQWKFLLRRLKGSCSIWEGGPSYEGKSIMVRYQQLYSGLQLDNGHSAVIGKGEEDEEKAPELVTRWKLDLSEGNERQRRRLLPNYEFHSMYNVDEKADHDVSHPAIDHDDEADYEESQEVDNYRTSVVVGTGMEATAQLLKELNLKTVTRHKEDDDFFDDVDEDAQTEATSATGSSLNDGESVSKASNAPSKSSGDNLPATVGHEEGGIEAENASSYELITGLLQPGDWPEHSFNVQRCTGLEVRKALLLWCRDAIYVIDGFEQPEGEGLDGKITRVEKELSSYSVNLRPKDFKVSEERSDDLAEGSVEGGDHASGRARTPRKATLDSSNEVTYQHRSQRIGFSELVSVVRRRYQLQQIALEFYDVHSNGTLIAFDNHHDREEILAKVLTSHLPNSIFNSSYGASINYKKFMATQKAKVVSQWVNGKMTNFEFLMHLNSFAGRTYNDLTQYPVFPWVIADYDSEEIDLRDPSIYRDLSKPMGALGAERAQQFKDRYEALEANYFNEDEPPPFHYGTHYSCAAYVLYYLMRLEPFSRLALTLQGGRFDVADRLFHNVGNSWKSASVENLQDVRELIPEFFYLSDFLTNTNNFDFGTTQKGKTVHDVTLPKWAKGDPNRFIRINRQALESEYVSKHLHLWIDLVFGYKQRGKEAVEALNIFVHVTYEGEVDLDAMTDPVQRESTIAQIQNFGQTPSRLERRPFPQRLVFQSLKDKNIDFGALPYLAPLTPPFCIVGAPQRCQVKRALSETCKLGITGQADKAVGDMCLFKGQLIGVGRMCALNIPQKKYYRYGGPNSGLSVHVASPTVRSRELNKMLSIHDGMHRSEISVAKASLDGQWVVTGCIDSTVRVWKYDTQTLKLCATLCGHRGSKITCLDVSTEFGTIVTGCARGFVLLWDLRTLTFMRRLRHSFKEENDASVGLLAPPASSVSINHKNGNIVTLVGSHLSVFDINGRLLATESSLGARPTCAVATDCSEWLESGIVVVTGHVNGEVRFWTLSYDTKELVVHYLMVDMEHICEITALRVTGVDRQDTLLVGDKSGKMSICKTGQLEHMSQRELAEVVSELRAELKQEGHILPP